MNFRSRNPRTIAWRRRYLPVPPVNRLGTWLSVMAAPDSTYFWLTLIAGLFATSLLATHMFYRHLADVSHGASPRGAGDFCQRAV